MLLPNLWLWDMVDEFVYQFQSFCQYRQEARTAERLHGLRCSEACMHSAQSSPPVDEQCRCVATGVDVPAARPRKGRRVAGVCPPSGRHTDALLLNLAHSILDPAMSGPQHAVKAMNCRPLHAGHTLHPLNFYASGAQHRVERLHWMPLPSWLTSPH